MKQVIKNYSFNAVAKTVTLTDFTTVRLDRLQLIVDVTTNAILYNFADATVATAVASTNVFTLSTVGTASGTDNLQIIYDCATGDPTYDTQPVSAASLPLPTSAATSTKQSDGSQKTQIVDGSGNVISATTNALDINLKTAAATLTVSQTVGTALAAWSSQPTQTAAAGADTVLKFGSAGTTSPNHISLQNNNTINWFYAFDQDSTASTSQVYILAPGQFAWLDRSFAQFHCHSSSQVSIGGTSGFTIEAFS